MSFLHRTRNILIKLVNEGEKPKIRKNCLISQPAFEVNTNIFYLILIFQKITVSVNETRSYAKLTVYSIT